MSRLPIVMALLLAAPLASAQQIYKWTDAQGTVHYSQSAPAQGTHYQQVKLAGGVEAADTPTAQPASGDAATITAPAPKSMADTPANRATLCATLKSNLATLQGSGPVVVQTGGKPSLLSDIQRKQQATDANTQYQQYCTGK